MKTNFARHLFDDLMLLVKENDKAFYHVDHLFDGVKFRVFNYHLASYTLFLKPSALECRGIMFEIDANNDSFIRLASLPPRKFFNNKENPFVMNVDFSKTELVMDKMDGSIMTTYTIGNKLYLKSKTSVTSEQATAANAFLNSEKASMLLNYLTYMEHAGYSVTLEWTSPQHRIVLPYQESNLTVLCARDRSNGVHVSYDQLITDMEEYACENNLVKDYSKTISPERLQDFIDNIRHEIGIEGYVIFADGMFTKHKTDWYCVLHGAKDSISSDKKLFGTVIRQAHDDLRSFYHDDAYTVDRIDRMEKKVQDIYKDIDENTTAFYHANQGLDRKDFAIKAQAEVPRLYFNIVMNLYLGKSMDYSDWMIKHYKDFGITDDPENSDNGEGE